jgi:hypothetical protein
MNVMFWGKLDKNELKPPPETHALGALSRLTRAFKQGDTQVGINH